MTTFRYADLITGLSDPESEEAARDRLYDLFLDHVSYATRSRPDVWFEECRRDEAALTSLSHRLQTRSERSPYPWFPFRGRTPYATWVAEWSPDTTVRHFTYFNRKYALLKELMRSDYRKNVQKFPEARARADLWKRVGALLKRLGEANGVRGGVTVWRLVRSPDPEDALGRALRQAMEEAGGEATQAQLVAALQAHAAPPELAEQPGTRDAEALLRVRRAVARAWERLDADDRALVEAIAAGDTALEVYQRHPHLASKVQVTRRLTRVDESFLQELADELGTDVRAVAATAHTPKALCELLYSVVADILAAGGATREPSPRRFPLPSAEADEPFDWEGFERLWDALHDPALARTEGLGDSLVAGVGAVASVADPLRLLADAEIDEAWGDGDEEP